MSIPEIPGYTDLTQVAQGSSSVVYRAEDAGNSRQVAIKVLKAPDLTEQDREAFKREVSAMGQLSSHPHIVDLIGSGFLASGRPYIVMPFYRNGNYGVFAEERGPLEWRQLLDFGVKVASALETAHRRGYVHRDIKPANIYRSDFAGHPVLADFGVSSFVSPSLDGSPTVAVAGTPLFSAPEVLNGVRPTVSSDIYSLGTTLFGLAEGRAAYADPSMTSVIAQITSDDPPPTVTADMPAALKALIARMMAKQPEDRPGSALEVVRDLNAVQRDNGLMVTPPLIRIEEADEAGPQFDVQSDVPSDAPLKSQPQSGSRPEAGPESQPEAGPSVPVRSVAPARKPSGLGDQQTMTVHPLDRPTEPIKTAVAPKNSVTFLGVRRPRWLAPIVVGLLGVLGIATYTFVSGQNPIGGPSDGETELAGVGPIDQRWTDGLQLVDAWAAHDGAADAVEWAADGTRLATGGRGQSLKIWEVGQVVEPLSELSLENWILDLQWSPDGSMLAAAGSDGDVLIWTVAQSGEAAVTRFAAHEGSAEAVTWSPDGQLLASGGADGAIRIWRADGTEDRTIQAHDQSIMALDWATDAALPTSGAKDATARTWVVDADDEVDTDGGVLFEAHDDWVRSVTWGPGAELLATSSSDRTVRIWSGLSGQQEARLDLESDPLGSVAWSPDGRLLAVGGEDGSVLLWNGSAQAEMISATGPGGSVTGLSWSSDRETVAVGRLDGSVEIWRAAQSG